MRVAVVPIGEVHDAVISTVVEAIRTRLDARVQTLPPLPLPSTAYVDNRNQFRGDALLAGLDNADCEDDLVRLGITLADIFYGDRDYVFGLAEPGGNALVGCHRLTSAIGAAGTADPEVVTTRIRTEAVHELGHVLGLSHCTNERCVMRFSGDVTGVDRKSSSFCDACRPTLDTATKELDRDAEPTV